MKVLTVVVPVYNMEKFLRKCLDSLVLPNELMNCLEVIVVNDGGKDGSFAIMREYGEKYFNTFIVVDKENGGHGSCCNIGLAKATGKYIHILDSDDWFDEKGFPTYLKILKDADADVIMTTKINEKAQFCISQIDAFAELKIGKLYNISSDIDFFKFKKFYFDLHHCSYKTELLKQIGLHFREHVSYDDMILHVAPYSVVNSVIRYDIPLYHYYIGRGGQSMDASIVKRKFSQLVIAAEDMNFSLKHGISAYNSEMKKELARRAFYDFLFNLFFSYLWSLNYKNCKEKRIDLIKEFSLKFIFSERKLSYKNKFCLNGSFIWAYALKFVDYKRALLKEMLKITMMKFFPKRIALFIYQKISSEKCC